MNQEKTHMPFPQIPYGYFDGEVKPDLPTPKTTLLFDPIEKMVLGNDKLLIAVEQGKLVLPPTETEIKQELIEGFRCFADWAISGNSDTRRKVKAKIYEFCDKNYPMNYESFSFLISLQQHSRNSIFRNGLEELKREIDFEYKPLTNTKLQFLFDPHSVETSEEYRDVKNELRQELSEVFVKSEKNIFFQERVYENKLDLEEDERLRAEGLEKYKSFLMSLMYSDFVRTFRKKPTNQELVEHVGKIREKVSPETAPKFSYHLLTAKVLDEFVKEGFEVEMVFEKAILSSQKHKTDDGNFRYDRLADFKESVMWIHNTSKLRNISIIRQVDEVAQNAEENNEKTNIFVRLGTNHAILLRSLSVRLRKTVTGASIVPQITRDKITTDYLKCYVKTYQ